VEAEVFGPYRLDELIGRGGMGEVFRAYDTRRNRVVALKRLPRQLATDDEYRARFQRESALVARLTEPHIIPIHDYGEIDGQLFIDMRLVEGGDLSNLISQEPLPVRRAVDIVSQIADALDAAHAEGLVHRDVKPPNVLLVGGRGDRTYPDRGVAYLADFGIARELDGPTLSQAGLAIGSAGYMAPERFTGDHWDSRVDVYSLACVLYECLVGHRPFPGKSLPAAMHAHLTTPPPRPSAERPELPRGLDETIARGMAKDPEQRYSSAGDLAFAARALVETGSRSVPQPAGPALPTPRPLGTDAGRSPGSGPLTSGPMVSGSIRTPTGPGPVPAGQGAWPNGGPSGPNGVQAGPPRAGTGPGAAWTTAAGPTVPATSALSAREQAPPAPPPVPTPRVYRRRTLLIAGGVVVAGGLGWGGWTVARALRGPGPWTVTTGDKVYSSAAVGNGLVYIGSNDSNLYALDAGTGDERWHYKAGGQITSTPAVVNGVVYVGCDDHQLHAVDATTGQARWQFDTGAAVHSSPTVVNGVVYIGCRSNSLVAVDAATGALRWRFPAGDWFNSSPAVVNGLVYCGCRDTNVYCLDAASGAERWRFTTTSSVDSSPRVVDNAVYIGTDDKRVLSLDATTGKLIWQHPNPSGGVVSTPAIADGVLYVGSDDHNLYALAADTGEARWTYPTAGGIRSSPVVAGDLVYVGSQDRYLHAVSRANGQRRWAFKTPGPIDDSSPKVADGLVYIGSLGHTVHAVDAITGAGAT
jgi:outer membrane protein assembly factor BamB/serine/threonine protein kinase